jgi:hypothetical protein
MIRFLSLLVLCLSLVLSGAEIAAARVLMASEAVMLRDIVICGASGAQVVTLDADGNAVPRKAAGHCRICPECQQTAGIALIGNPAAHFLPAKATAASNRFAVPLVLTGGPSLSPPARAPPREL